MIGIDLGTTHSLVSVWKDEQPTLIQNSDGAFLTPSIVGCDASGQFLIGKNAASCEHSIANFKRFMGTEKTFHLGGKSFRPEELSALVIKSLVQDAERFLGCKIEEAVISVPAYFNNTQRNATRLAGQLAGLKVERLINEPTAAALAYGIHDKDKETKFLIFDLGGGTFDVSVVETFSGIIEVRSSAGDNYLGGEDFSNALEMYVRAQLPDGCDVDARAIHAIKHDLSSKETVRYDFGGSEIQVTRKAFEAQCSPLIERLEGPIAQALSDARIKPSELDSVILVGGATRMPMIQSVIARMLGHFPQSAICPDEAVGMGTAVQAGLKERNVDLKDVVVTDVCPFSLGTSVRKDRISGDGRFLPIIPRNTVIPVSRETTLVPTQKNQTTMLVDVYQGESFNLEENIEIGTLVVPIPPGEEGQKGISVRYSYDVNGLLEVFVEVISTGKQKSLLIENRDHRLSQEEIEASLKKLEALKIHPRHKPENQKVLQQLESLFVFHNDEVRDEVAEVLSDFSQALESQNDQVIKESRNQVEEFVKALEDSGW
ncbi:MAG: Hsp70 family protein [Chlamydiia bacterium]|nr:Hsp70 family protein [Chlamydiia bacterium]